MKRSKLFPASIAALTALSLAGVAGASMTERLEAKYLKSRIKLRMTKTGESSQGMFPGPRPQPSTMHRGQSPMFRMISALPWSSRRRTIQARAAGTGSTSPCLRVLPERRSSFSSTAFITTRRCTLNGTQVGGQQYGYVSFICDLTPYLNATGDNVLAVFVDNLTVRNSRWYSGTGIFRHVWLIATDKVYVRNWGTAVTTPTVAAAQSQISVQTDVVNDLATDQTRTLETVIYDEAGSELTKTSTPDHGQRNSTVTTTQSLTLSSVTLWSPSTPVRYYAYSQLLNNASLADDYVTPFGIRELKYTPGTGLTINGMPTKMKGVCLHHTLVPAGAAVADSMWERAIKEMKASGANSIRTSHNPYSPEFYDICDQQGMLVMDEFTDKWSQPASAGGVTYENWDANWQKDVKSFIERDRNHPSVVMWSMGNEVYYGGTIPAYITTTMGQLVPYVHALDKGSSRPCFMPATCRMRPAT
jgi:beta-galactosidase